jgi:superfamily II DNA or RNA helicase
MMYEVADYLTARGFSCEVSLPKLGDPPYDWKFVGTYRPRQEDAVQTLIRDRFGVLKAAPGFGKTVCMAAVTANVGRKTAIIVQAGEPFDQAYNTLRKLTTIPKIGRVSGEVRDIQPVTVYMIQSLSKEIRENANGEVAKAFAEAEVVMVDECFPKGTSVSGRAIEHLKVGDWVESYNHNLGQVEWRQVKRTFKSRPMAMVRVWFDDGSFQDCTAGHPFWVGDNYVPAYKLSSGSVVYIRHHANALRVVLGRSRGRVKESEGSISKQDGGYQPQVCIRADEEEQSYASWGQFRTHEKDVETHRAQTSRPLRQWTWVDALRDTLAQLFGWVGRSLHSEYRDGASQRIPNTLQDRYRSPTVQDRHRSRWAVARSIGALGARSQKGSLLAGKRVDCVEVHQQTSDGTFGGVCPDGYVYNIEVDGNHNYFANGVLVHNCHHAAADTYLMALEHVENPKFVLGFSATPEDREDGLQPFVNAYLGRPRYEVTYGEQIDLGSLCPVTIYVTNIPERDYGYSKDRDIPAYRKRKLYQEVYDSYVVKNRVRNQEGLWFTQDMIDQGHSVAIIVSRVPHAHEIHKMYPQAVVLTGETSKSDRRDILSKLRRKEIMCVVTTLFDEATDVPSLGAVCMLAGGKTEIRLRQRIRSTRTFSGETARGYYTKTRGYVWYPIDQADFLRSHSIKCLKTLRAIVKEHPLNELLWVQ